MCMVFAALEFTLEIVGILYFAWDQMGIGVVSFASGSTLFYLVALFS